MTLKCYESVLGRTFIL